MLSASLPLLVVDVDQLAANKENCLNSWCRFPLTETIFIDYIVRQVKGSSYRSPEKTDPVLVITASSPGPGQYFANKTFIPGICRG